MKEKTVKFIIHSKQEREISLTLGTIHIFVGQLCLSSIGFKMKSNITLVLLAFVEPAKIFGSVSFQFFDVSNRKGMPEFSRDLFHL